MLSAWNQSREEVLAEEVELSDGPFYCPACREQLILKQGRKVVAHFAHWPDADCEYTNEGESEEHRLAKREIRQALLQVPGVTDIRLERYLREVRPDVSFVVNGQLVAIEIQLSQLSLKKIEGRTKSYARKNIAVLWMPLFSMELLEARYAPRDWERYLHRMYYGKVYYWFEGLLMQPVKFGEYLLEPDWWSGKRYRSVICRTLWQNRTRHSSFVYRRIILHRALSSWKFFSIHSLPSVTMLDSDTVSEPFCGS